MAIDPKTLAPLPLAAIKLCPSCKDGLHLTCLGIERGCMCDLQECRIRAAAIKPAHDPVNRPAHYTSGKIEVIDFIEDQKLGFHLGNAVKYISRAGKKDPAKLIEDLEKARWYLDRKIKNLKESADGTQQGT